MGARCAEDRVIASPDPIALAVTWIARRRRSWPWPAWKRLDLLLEPGLLLAAQVFFSLP